MTYGIVAVVAVLVGLDKAGFGGSMISLAILLMANRFGPSFATGVTLPLLIAGDVFVCWRFYGRWDRRLVATLLPGAVLGIGLGSWLLIRLAASEQLFKLALGSAALVFSGLQIGLQVVRARRATRELPSPTTVPPRWIGVAAGTMTGVTSTVAHQGGIVSNLYLLAQGLTNERFVGTTGLVYVVINSLKLVPYATQGVIDHRTLVCSLCALPLVPLGGVIGARYTQRVKPLVFANVILAATIVLGLKLIVEAILK